MAPNGVSFLDELPEFPRNVLEVFRQPLKERRGDDCTSADDAEQ
jgi:predicted ATPase with chaperone activity